MIGIDDNIAKTAKMLLSRDLTSACVRENVVRINVGYMCETETAGAARIRG